MVALIIITKFSYLLVKHLFRVAIVAVGVLNATSGYAENNHLSMGMLSVTKKINDRHTLFAAGGTVVENFKGELATIGVTRKLSDAVSWQGAYFLYSARIDGEERHYDHRLRGSLTYRHNMGDWNFWHRSRLEYRVGDVDDGFRYRPAFILSHPLSLGGLEFGPFLEFEPIYDLRQHSTTLSLYTAGTTIPVHERAKLVVAYFRVHNEGDSSDTFGPEIILNIKL